MSVLAIDAGTTGVTALVLWVLCGPSTTWRRWGVTLPVADAGVLSVPAAHAFPVDRKSSRADPPVHPR